MSNLHPTNWRREASLVALAAAEASLVAPWVLVLLAGNGGDEPVLHGPAVQAATGVCLGLVLGTLYLARALQRPRIPPLLQRGVLLTGMLGVSGLLLWLLVADDLARIDWAQLQTSPQIVAALVQLLPPALVVILGVTWLCWRGLRLAYRLPGPFDVTLGFKIGIVVLSFFLMLNTGAAVLDTSLVFVPMYFFSQLLAAGLTRVESVSRIHEGRTPFSGWWVAVLAGSTGLVVVAAGLISSAVLGVGPEGVLIWVGPFLALLALPFVLILVPLVGLLRELLGEPLQGLVEGLGELVARLQSMVPAPSQAGPPAFVLIMLRVLGYTLGGLVVLLVLYLLVRVAWSIGRRRAEQGDEGEQKGDRDALWSRRGLLRRLRARLQQRLARLRRLRAMARRFGPGGLLAAWTIRRVYAQTLRLAAARGHARPAARTPYEHLVTLQAAFAGCAPELGQITDAYVGVHYGELPESPDAVGEIRAAFERVKAVLR